MSLIGVVTSFYALFYVVYISKKKWEEKEYLEASLEASKRWGKTVGAVSPL